MDSNWRWDLGQGYCIRAQPKSGKGICTSAGINDKWLWWWFRWYEVSTIDKRCPTKRLSFTYKIHKSTHFLRFYLYMFLHCCCVFFLPFFCFVYLLMHHISNLSNSIDIFSNLSACWAFIFIDDTFVNNRADTLSLYEFFRESASKLVVWWI